ncbi:BTAD domain-containing putative transcriptional regulator [Actinomadura sp. 3N508]|uniref:BTAD domain-containing putative transcriptional regulator n=1 Tax=Actinomadura sp. 3N508 TaxID=3375153 RepID=UPI00378BCEAA
MIHSTRTRTRATEILRGLGALLVFAVLLAGLPIGLYAVAGSPIPGRLPSWDHLSTTLMQPDTDHHLLLAAMRLLGWLAWGVFTTATCAETTSYLARRSSPRLPRPVRPLQLLARDLVATATLAFSTTAAVTTLASTTANAHVTADAQPQSHQKPPSGQDAPPAHSQDSVPLLGGEHPHGTEPGRRTWRTRIIHRGDTLWDLARRAYGSGTLYPKIFKASRTLDQPDGIPTLTSPDDLHPGQRIRIPLTPKKSTAPPPARGPHPTNAEGDSTPEQGRGRTIRPPQTVPTTAEQQSQAPNPTVAATADDPPPSRQSTTDAGPSSAITLPSGSSLGLGLAAALSLAVAATRLHQRRRRPSTDTENGNVPIHEPALPKPVTNARKAHLDGTYAALEAPIPSDADLVAADRTASPPDHVVLGTRDHVPVTLPLAGLTLGLTGDGAHAAARAITTELLATAHRDRAEVFIPQPDAGTLYPGTTLTGIPGLTITPTLAAATTHLEAEILRRARLMETTDQPDLATLRATNLADPLPTLLLAATIPESCTASVQAIIELGHRYGIGALILGPAPTGTTLHLPGGTAITKADGPHTDALTGARLFHLTADDASAMLHILRTATGTPEPETTATQPPGPSPGHADYDAAPSETGNPAPHSAAEDHPHPIRLQVLGPVRLHTADGPITTGIRRSARDLLAYLALNPNGITRDQAIGALWPDHHPDTATTQFNTAVANIRKTLRTATELREPMYVIHTAGRYRLDPDLIDVDEQRLTTALARARHATTDAERLTALHAAADLYTAEFATDLTHDWAENHREHLRRAVTDALTRLAQLLQPDHPERALSTLEQAITHDPYAEPLYRNLMRLQADLGRPDAARRTYQHLTSRLADLDIEPDEQTHQLLTSVRQGH